MVTLIPLPEFSSWLNALKDNLVRGVILARLKRLECGLAGDVESVGGGVIELRIHLGAGWRVYYMHRGKHLVVLLAGGNKHGQRADIDRARALAALID